MQNKNRKKMKGKVKNWKHIKGRKSTDKNSENIKIKRANRQKTK